MKMDRRHFAWLAGSITTIGSQLGLSATAEEPGLVEPVHRVANAAALKNSVPFQEHPLDRALTIARHGPQHVPTRCQ